MTRPAPKVVLDASAILAWVLRERGHETIDMLLHAAVVPAPNLTEVLYKARERGHRMSGDALYQAIIEMGVAVEPFTADDVVRAAALVKESRRRADPRGASVSLGDAACLAVAERLGLIVAGGDQEWETLDLRVAYRPFR